MNKREEAKENTIQKIILGTVNLIGKKGIRSLTTNEVADYCGVAHGTVFRYFPTREDLIAGVISGEIRRISALLYTQEQTENRWEELYREFFHILKEEESFFVSLYRELPFLSSVVQQSYFSMEITIRNRFYLCLERHFKNKERLTSIINVLFSQLYYYLSLKDSFIISGSILEKKEEEIFTNFKTLIKEGEKDACL